MSPIYQKVTAIIKTFERPDSLDRLIKSIKRFYPDLAIIVADDSKNPTIREDVAYHALPFDTGLAEGRNYLVRQAKTPYVLLLDDDFCFIKETVLEKLIYVLDNSDIDIVGGRLLCKGNIVNSLHGRLVVKGEVLYHIKKSYGEQCGCKCYDIISNFFLARTSALLQYQWDAKHKIGGEHVDFFLTHKGHINVALHPEVFIYHHKSRSGKQYSEYRSRSKSYIEIMRKHHGYKQVILEGEPHYLPLKTALRVEP